MRRMLVVIGLASAMLFGTTSAAGAEPAARAEATAVSRSQVIGCGAAPTYGSHPNHPTIRYGSRGDDVKEAQCRMANDFSQRQITAADGIFGSDTLSAVRAVQTWCRARGRADVAVDGVVGPKAWGIIHWSHLAWLYDACFPGEYRPA